jgi:hypothetical protein
MAVGIVSLTPIRRYADTPLRRWFVVAALPRCDLCDFLFSLFRRSTFLDYGLRRRYSGLKTTRSGPSIFEKIKVGEQTPRPLENSV